MLTHAVLQIGRSAYIELSPFVDDVNVPIAHKLFDRDRLPSPALWRAQDKLTTASRWNQELEIEDGTDFLRPPCGWLRINSHLVSLQPGIRN